MSIINSVETTKGPFFLSPKDPILKEDDKLMYKYGK
jgi:hypothetical protein